MLVSVIIPVYNAAEFIGKCVSSVLEQTLNDLEVICVDDRSSDDSFEVLSRLEDPRLKIIRFPENRGVSAARNAGLEAASGKYVYFLDSDDWLDPDYLEAMTDKAEETGEDRARRARNDILRQINSDAALYFMNNLYTPHGEKGLRYLKDRGLSDETIRHFGLGFAGNNGREVVEVLRKKGYSDEMLVASGIATNSEKYGMGCSFFGKCLFLKR